jgi:uncharacterized membrane protein
MQPNDRVNPYQSPGVEVMSAAPGADAEFIDGGRSVPIGNGLSWIGSGWAIFTQSPLAWIVSTIIILVTALILSFVPILGSIVSYVLYAVFGGGLMMGCQAQHAGRPLEIGDLFSGFKEKAGPLLIVGLLFVAASIALMVVAGILFAIFIGSTGLFGSMMMGDADAFAKVMTGGSIMALMVIGLVVVALYVPIAMAFWFASTLVALQNVSPVTAVRMSFFACLKNFLPFLIYGVVFFVIFIIASLPFGLGLLVALPLLYASTYAAYRDIFLGD